MTKTLELYNTFKDTLGEAGARVLIEAFDEVYDRGHSNLATKEDIGRLEASLALETERIRAEIQKVRSEIEKLRSETHSEIEKLRADTHSVIEKLRADTHSEIEKLRADTHSEIEKLRFDTHSEIEKLRAETRVEIERTRAKIEKSKTDTVKWLFVFWASQLGAVFALFKFFMK